MELSLIFEHFLVAKNQNRPKTLTGIEPVLMFFNFGQKLKSKEIEML